MVWLGLRNYDNVGPDAAKLIQTALSQHPDAIIGADWVPEAMDAAFKQVAAAHVPLIIYNSGGMDAAKRLGAMNYIGNEEYAAGLGGGEYWGSHGAKDVLCVNTLPGGANTEDRCRGIADGIGKSRRQIKPVAAAFFKLWQPYRSRRSYQGCAAQRQNH